MTSYFSSLTSGSAISSLGTRFNSLRRAITSGEESDDPENEDCSHISNVLRAYYTEKGRPFPAWLPPDPKAPPPPQPRVVATTQVALQQGYGGQSPALSSGGGRGGLSDLWGDSGSSQPPPSQQTSSLRRPRIQPQAASTGAGIPHSQTPPPPSGGRPLPSQRAESFQSTQSAPSRPFLDRTGSGSSAQERLRARLYGGSSTPSPSSTTPPSLSPGYTAYSGGGGGGGVPRKPLGGGIGLPSGPKIHR